MSTDHIIDAHFHVYAGRSPGRFIRALLKASELTALNIASIPGGLAHGEYFCNREALKLKLQNPGRVLFFGGLDYSDRAYLRGDVDFAAQARTLIEAGADGIKMLEGKPNVRKALGMSLASPILQPFYAYMEKQALPILLHVADPEEFWDADKVPGWARDSGWFWGDGSYPTKAQLYRETEEVLARFPRLRVILAHFYFLSADLKAATRFMERWPAVCLDITPGIEMYHNFTRQPAGWRRFFERYQDRIIFGTDNTSPPPKTGTYAACLQTAVENIRQIRTFLETDEAVYSGRGLKLSQAALRKIYAANFRRLLAHGRCSRHAIPGHAGRVQV